MSSLSEARDDHMCQMTDPAPSAASLHSSSPVATADPWPDTPTSAPDSAEPPKSEVFVHLEVKNSGCCGCFRPWRSTPNYPNTTAERTVEGVELHRMRPAASGLGWRRRRRMVGGLSEPKSLQNLTDEEERAFLLKCDHLGEEDD